MRPLITCIAISSAIILATTPMAVVSNAPALATVDCGSFANAQVGFSTNMWHGASQPTFYEGVSANLTDRFGYVLCDSDTNPGTNFVTT